MTSTHAASIRYGSLSIPLSGQREINEAFGYLAHDPLERSIIERLEHSRTPHRIVIDHHGDDSYARFNQAAGQQHAGAEEITAIAFARGQGFATEIEGRPGGGVQKQVEGLGEVFPKAIQTTVQDVARRGSTPLLV